MVAVYACTLLSSIPTRESVHTTCWMCINGAMPVIGIPLDGRHKTTSCRCAGATAAAVGAADMKGSL